MTQFAGQHIQENVVELNKTQTFSFTVSMNYYQWMSVLGSAGIKRTKADYDYEFQNFTDKQSSLSQS